jgi:sensor histidine kinase regulating citrate/malate metabolism
MEAANSLLVHLKRPESQKIELDIAVKDDSVISELKDITMGLAAQQKKLLESGAYSVKDVSNQGLIIEGQLDE